MSNESFDDFLSTEQTTQQNDIKPFQFRDKPNDREETLLWLNKNFDNSEQSSLSRMITYRRYHSLFKGIHWRYFDNRDNQRDTYQSERRPRHVVNFIWEMVDTKVSQQARLKTNFVAIPAHDDDSDINQAQTAELLLKSRAEQIDMDSLHSDADQVKHVFGHVFQHVYWNPEIGPMHPKFVELKKKGIKIPNKKKKGKFLDEVKVGDADVKNLGPDRFFPEIGKKDWQDVDYAEWVDWENIEKLKAEYPSQAEKIQPNRRDYFDYEFTEITRPDNMIMVRHFYHRPTKWLPAGVYIKYTDDAILSWSSFPYDHAELPFVPDTDIDVYNEFWGRSFIMNIEQLQRMFNNIQSGVARDYGIGSAPKWMMPKGSAEVSSLNNEFTIVEYSGPVAPKLVESRPTSNQAFQVQDRIEKKISQHSSVYDISRGEVPTGVTANSALRFLDEQESQRTMKLEIKRKKRVIKVYKMMLQVMQQYYKSSDGRTLSILGPKNEYMFDDLKDLDLSKVADIRLQNSSSLPDTKTGRISTIVDLNMSTQTDPIFTKEEIIQLLDLGLDEAYVNGATVAVNTARRLFEGMLKGAPAPEPKNTDNFLVYYSMIDKTVQSVMFTEKASDKVKAEFVKYINTLEYLMFERAKINQRFWSKLMELDNFPMIFKAEAPLATLQINFAPPAPPEAGGTDTSKMGATDEMKNTAAKKAAEQA